MKKIIRVFAAYIPHTFFACIALFILGPLLAPGFVLTLDMVFTPSMPLPETLSASYPFYALLHMLHWIVPADVLQKAVLFCIFFFGGLGTYRLILFLSRQNDVTWQLAAYIAGVFYVINPFTFTRFMAGHFALLLGLALLPWFVRLWLTLLQISNLKLAIKNGLLIATIGALSVHSLAFVAIIGLVGFVCYWPKSRGLGYVKTTGRYAVLTICVAIVCMGYWLLPTLFGNGYIAESLAHFGVQDRMLFATQPDKLLGLVGTVLALYGFWADNQPLYVLPKDVNEWWLLPVLLLWFVLIAGLVIVWHVQKRLAIFIASIAFIGCIGALGFQGHILATFTSWVANYIPFLNGMREPQKYTVLLVLSYTLLLSYCLQGLFRHMKRLQLQLLACATALLLVFAITPGMVWGFGGQVRAVDYPASWSKVQDILRTDAARSKVLALPWHHYMNYQFVGRTIASPVDKFFDAEVIISDQPELGGLRPQVYNEDTAYISTALKQHEQAFAQMLADRNVKYVILFKEADYTRYNALVHHKDFELVYSTSDIQLFKNTLWQQ